jgi:hypothetical protein
VICEGNESSSNQSDRDRMRSAFNGIKGEIGVIVPFPWLIEEYYKLILMSSKLAP